MKNYIASKGIDAKGHIAFFPFFTQNRHFITVTEETPQAFYIIISFWKSCSVENGEMEISTWCWVWYFLHIKSNISEKKHWRKVSHIGQDGRGYAAETNNSQIWWVEDNRSSFMLIPPAHYGSAGASAPCSLPSVINEEEIATNRNIDDF